MAYWFVPPVTVVTQPIIGSLRYKLYRTLTAYKDAAGWHVMENPDEDFLATCIKWLPGRPQQVDNATAAELIAAGVGDLTLLS